MTTSPDVRPRRTSGRIVPVLVILALVLGFFLFTEHRAHLFGLVPYGLVLLCPLMHLFMHGGHAHHGKPGRAGMEAGS
jgi:hypothetical protein